MKIAIKIMLLSIKIYALKKRRDKFLLYMYYNFPNEVNRAANIEDTNPQLFHKIDKKINSTRRFITKLRVN